MKRALCFGLALLVTSESAFAFDSRCRVGTAECEPGPDAARRRWNASDAEHNKLWDQTVSALGLPSHLTSLVRLSVPSDSEIVGGFDTVQPKAFFQSHTLVEREYQISEMAQLPDLSYSLWDWALGNEYCPIGNDPIGPCHRFASHMGTLNSNHFLPLAEHFYQYYHKLAMERAKVCADMRNAMGTQFPAFPEQCDQQAFTFEAIGHHFLQDAWSMGHMWPRWGGPNPADFGGANWREAALIVALTTGIIHGSKGVLQEALDGLEFSESWKNISISHPDVRDAMCAPINPQDFSCDTDKFLCMAPDFWSTLQAPSYFDAVDSKVKRGIGDLYASEFATSPLYSEPYQRMLSCGRASVAELALAAGLNVAAADGPAPSSAEFHSRCFDHQATNGSMWLGAGVDLVIDKAKLDAITVDFPIIGKVDVVDAREATIYVRIPLTPIVGSKSVPKLLKPLLDRLGLEELGLSEAIVALSEKKGELTLPASLKAQARRDLATIADFLEDRARANPNGTDAQANLPTLVGIGRSDGAGFKHTKPADYVDVDKPYTPSIDAVASQSTDADKQTAIARAYHRGFATEWCAVTKVSDLELLKTEEGGPRCEICAEFASRHIRIGHDISDYDNYNVPVCEYLGGSEFVYLPVADTSNLAWDDLGRQWCGCADKPQTTCSGRAEGRIVDATTGDPITDAIATFNSPTASGSAMSEGDGTFFSDKLACDTYTVEISALGYMTAEISFTIEEDGSETQLIELQAIDESCAEIESQVVGSVVDAATGEFVAGATVELREGADAPVSAAVIASMMTDNNGVYSFDVPGGYYTVHVERSGYQPSGARSSPACGTEVFQRDIALVPTEKRALSFVLTWAQPDDLDFHLLLPTGDEVSFGDCSGSIDEEPFAQLDVDHQMADGPEAISVSNFLPGKYTLYVHNFSAQNGEGATFQSSQAEVQVYQDSEPFMRVVVPTSGDGYFWDVLEFEGTLESFDIRQLNVLRNDRPNPLAEEYLDTCTPGGPL